MNNCCCNVVHNKCLGFAVSYNLIVLVTSITRKGIGQSIPQRAPSAAIAFNYDATLPRPQIIIMASTASHDDSYYSILGLPKRATQDEIKRAYRALSQVYHPDKQQGSGRQQHASQIFTKILEAYEVCRC